MPADKPAVAWLLYPDRDDPQRWIVEIEKPYGDVVSLRFLPVALNAPSPSASGQPPLLFRWRYGREAEGSAFLLPDKEGHGGLEFEFLAREPIDGQRLGAAAVLVAIDGAPLHVLFALTDPMNGSFENGAQRQNIRLSLDRPPEWWRNVEAIAFFTMRYYPQQELDDEEAWAAMRRAVGNFTQGRGTEQRE
ncbi:hypothetical protein [Mesorhizobium sp. IMUNJ 23232]|uniref:hypothetical protein n=1 Tax=Mesorhizobium sp. IMUNJ 23232 TaxID=3376064 RepID=UPI00379C63D3